MAMDSLFSQAKLQCQVEQFNTVLLTLQTRCLGSLVVFFPSVWRHKSLHWNSCKPTSHDRPPV
jgi:hypothetical protein